MSDVRFWVKRYKSEGWSPIPIPPGEKGPRISGWETKDFDVPDFQDDSNVGVHLGKGDLYDVDIDDKSAVVAADLLLPPTARISGRPSKPRSHRFYTCDEKIEHAAYHGLGGTNDTIVELRGFTKNGTYTQTVVPPSVHPSGELTAWDVDQKPGHYPKSAILQHGVRNIAIAVLLARAFPGPGNRHKPRLAMAGFLHRAGLEDLEVMAIGRAVMELIGGDVSDWQDVCRTTLAKLKQDRGAQATGGPTLKETLADGDQVLKKLNTWLGRTGQAAVDDVIDRLNRHYFIIEAGTSVVIGDDSNPEGIRLWPFQEFKKKFCKDFMPGQRGPDKVSPKGVVTPGKLKKGRPIVDVWIEHPRGRKANQLLYVPPGSKVVPEPGDFNGWKGFRCEPRAGDWPLMAEHIRAVICESDPDLHAWVLNWCASLIQFPGERANTAIVLRGGQGVGKGTFAHDLLGKIFHRRHFVHLLDRNQFYGRFNDILSGRCLVFLDEATWGGNKEDAGVLKGRVTSDFLTVERKHLPALAEPSMMHLILASNEDWPVGVDRDDRRFCCLNVQNEQANAGGYFKPIYQELENGGREAFLHDMLTYPINPDILRCPPSSAGKDELKLRSLPPEAEWWLEKLHDGRLLPGEKGWPKAVIRSALYAEYVAGMQNAGVSRRLSSVRFGHFLRKACPSLGNERKGYNGPREYVLPTLKVARAEFEKYLGAREAWGAETPSVLPNADDDGF